MLTKSVGLALVAAYAALLLVQTALLVVRINGSVTWRWAATLVPAWLFFAAWIAAVVGYAVHRCHETHADDHDSDSLEMRDDDDAMAAEVDDASLVLTADVDLERAPIARETAAQLFVVSALLVTVVLVSVRLDGVALTFRGGWTVAFSPTLLMCVLWALWAVHVEAQRQWATMDRARRDAAIVVRRGVARRLAAACGALSLWPAVVGVVLTLVLVAMRLDDVAPGLPWPAALAPLWAAMAAWLIELAERWSHRGLIAASADWKAARAMLSLATVAYAAVLVFLVLLNVRLGMLKHAPIGVAALFAPLMLLFSGLVIVPLLLHRRKEHRAHSEGTLAWAHHGHRRSRRRTHEDETLA